VDKREGKKKKTKRKRDTEKVAGSAETSTRLCESVRHHISENCIPREVV